MPCRLFVARVSFIVIGLAVAIRAGAQVVGSPTGPERVAINATNVLAQSMTMQDGIPQKMLADAQGIVIVPGMVRGAFVIGAQYGRGLVLVRGPNGAWQPPRMLTLAGGSLGYQIGVQSTDLILVFRTPQSVANLLRGTLKIGVDASAAAGPVGRQASAATDVPLQAEILSYSRARGAFVGVSIDGSSISLDPGADAAYYQPPGAVPASAMQLVQTLTAYSAGGGPAIVAAAAPGAPGFPGPPAAVAVNGAEAAREQLDATSRSLVPILDDNWKQYLALPAEVYVPGGVPNPQVMQQAISHYEAVSQRPEYVSLATRPEFQETAKALWKFNDTLAAGNQALQLPPPPR